MVTNLVATLVTIGQLTLGCDNPGSWKFDMSVHEVEPSVEEVTITAKAPAPAVPPRFTVSFSVPQVDIQHKWFSGTDNYGLPPNWASRTKSNLSSQMPLYGLFSENDRNRLVIAGSEAIRVVECELGLVEEDCSVAAKLHYFTLPEAPISSYVTKIRLDKRDVFWSDALAAGSRWITEVGGYMPCAVPEAAFLPLYSTWYNMHQDVFADEIEKEMKLAADLGMKVLIVDDGWQTDDTNRGYAFTGDWKVSPRRFPDFAAHVERVHKLGMKYMIWYSVPFVGEKSGNYARFKGKYLRHAHGAGVLDPRFPEVRQFLVDTYVNAVKDWKLDGLKLDFIDQFQVGSDDPAIKENYAGRDIKSLPEAVNVLMIAISAELHKLNPDFLIEFRQSYIGPAIRQFGNMMRAGDCPANIHANRIRTTNLRITSGETAVHADMLEWNVADTPQSAARQIISTLFSTIQYSRTLGTLPADHLKMVKHWIDFTQAHNKALLKGAFRPHHAQAGYPILEGESDDERIIAVYNDSCFVRLPSDGKRTIVVNGTGADGLVVLGAEAYGSVKVFDTFGEEVKGDVIPESGYAIYAR